MIMMVKWLTNTNWDILNNKTAKLPQKMMKMLLVLSNGLARTVTLS